MDNKHIWEIETTEFGTVRIKSASKDPELEGCYMYKSNYVSG